MSETASATAVGSAGAITVHVVERRGPEAYIAELIGTFTLVLFVTMIAAVAGGLGVTDWAVIGLVHLLVLMMLVYSLGGTSGAHFNPAVTLALTAVRKIAPVDALAYLLCQVIGGLGGAAVTRLILSDEGANEQIRYGVTRISEQFLQGKPLPGLAIEAIGTFFLVWAIMAAAVNPTANRHWAGLIIGGTLGLLVMVFGPLTGGSFNPARSFGPAVAAGEWSDFWVYILAPVVGGVLAAFAYTAVVLKPAARLGERPVDKLP